MVGCTGMVIKRVINVQVKFVCVYFLDSLIFGGLVCLKVDRASCLGYPAYCWICVILFKRRSFVVQISFYD